MSRSSEVVSDSPIARSTNLRGQVYENLRRRIQRAEIGPDDRLVDLEIAASLGMSRMPVREALLQLTNEGYLVGTSRGFAIPTLTPADIAEVFEVRRLLEPRAAASVVSHLSAATEKKLEAAVRATERAVGVKSGQDLMLANAAFREAWLAEVRNRRLAATIGRFADHVQVVRYGTLFDPATQRIVLQALKGLLEAFETRDSLAVHDRMQSFIAKAEETFFALVERQDSPGVQHVSSSPPARKRKSTAV